MKPFSAILLIGPTGAGKTPLGALCEKKGLWHSNVFHFDFGAILRCIAATGPGRFDLTGPDVGVIRRSLATGKLLENRHFPIARNILLSYAKEKRMQGQDLMLLNGLPRHAGQAVDMEPFVRVIQVLALTCTPEVVKERIRRNTGGDRTRRKDDDRDAIETKLSIFRRQTAPLLDHYRQKGTPILSLIVEIDTTPERIYRQLSKPCDCINT
ncbi:MAG: nucleoside monophosphate kinase [Thermodesulfobacteriota bacterium]